jgi:NTE family protein
MSEKESKERVEGVGLALSGGGFRAALFHVGGLWRLNELGWLKQLSEVTSVSGGSITAGYLGLKWKHLRFNPNNVATNFVDEIVQPLQVFCSQTIDIGSLVGGLISPFHHPSTILASRLSKKLFGKATLQDLPSDREGPRFTIYATNLQTGVSVRFSHPYMADYRLGEIKSPEVEIAGAVTASCAFPPILCPVKFKFEYDDWKSFEGADLFDNEKLHRKMLLADGGVYDNLGLERIWNKYTTVLVSDAGAPFSIMENTIMLRLSQLLRTKRSLDIIVNQARALRKRWLIENFIHGLMSGTYWGIVTQIRDYELQQYGYPGPIVDDSDTTGSLSRLRTRLNRFSTEEQEQLINWGYALADAAMRRHVLKKGLKPGTLPFPQQPLLP